MRCWKSETSFQWLPIIISDFTENTVTAKYFLNRLGAHKKLKDNITEFEFNDKAFKHEKPFGNNYDQVLTYFYQYAKVKPLAFHAGSNLLNPFPCFVITRIG